MKSGDFLFEGQQGGREAGSVEAVAVGAGGGVDGIAGRVGEVFAVGRLRELGAGGGVDDGELKRHDGAGGDQRKTGRADLGAPG